MFHWALLAFLAAIGAAEPPFGRREGEATSLRSVTDALLCDSFPDTWRRPNMYADMINLLSATDRMFTRAGARYAVLAGTALGVERHAGRFVPWDDDIDVFTTDGDLRKFLAQVQPPFCAITFDTPWVQAKLFRCNGARLGSRQYAYPSVDLFTAERGFTAAAQNGASPERFAWPARRTTLEGVQVSAMRDARGHVLDEFGPGALTDCSPPAYSHRTEKFSRFQSRVVVPCARLMQTCTFAPHPVCRCPTEPVQSLQRLGAARGKLSECVCHQ